MTSLPTHRPITDLRRKVGRGPGRNGTLSPDAPAIYAAHMPRNPPQWTPAIEEIALVHRYLEPNPRVPSSSFSGMRTFAERSYHVARSYALIRLSDWEKTWHVAYYAMGSPSGWTYRLCAAMGAQAGFQETIAEICLLTERSASFPEELKLPRRTHQRFRDAKAWCAANAEPDAWLYFEGKFRFRDPGTAAMFKILWS